MPKMKTKKSVSSRFKLTGTGKLKRQRPGKRHILTKKTPKRKRQLRRPTLLSDTQLKMYKRLMCVK
ncbi:MAG: 50S ribosomal protein L35 [Chlamydiales bacterium]|nr:50S ribosomal protein L35 [Chlamydiia bacterium]MCP5508468.1 50S ribosomal protein L35 [Chlamydiales bacterium]